MFCTFANNLSKPLMNKFLHSEISNFFPDTCPILVFSIFNVSGFYWPQIGVKKYFLTSWANSTFCSSSLSSVCLALLSSNSSLFSFSTFFLSASAWTSSFCSISVRRFCCRGKSRRWTELKRKNKHQVITNLFACQQLALWIFWWMFLWTEHTNIKL